MSSTTAPPLSAVPEPVEHASRDELAALQLTRLQSTLRHAYDNVAFERASCATAGVSPDDLRGLDDLARFPLTRKQDLRATYPFGMFAVERERVARLHASSGTTGRPTVVGYTAEDLETWGRLVGRSLRASGVRPGMRVHVAYGYGLFTGGLGLHYGAEALGCTVLPASSGATERQVGLIRDLEPDAVCMTPSYLLMIADQMERAGLDPAHSSPRIAVLGAEPWTDAMRREIERRMDLDACDIYGLSEVMGPGVACECVETKDGPTLWEDHFYPEVIDPVDGTVLPDGRVGELVLTSLTKQAMPVIRYRTGDLTRLLPGTARTMRRIEKITGRGDDMMIVRGVNLFPTQVEEQVLQVHGLAPHFQCLITRPGRLDELTLRVEEAEAHPDGQHPDGQRPAAAAAELCRRMKETFGVSVRTELLPPGTLERSGGKAQRVRDERLPCPEAPETAAPETAAGPEAAAGRAE